MGGPVPEGPWTFATSGSSSSSGRQRRVLPQAKEVDMSGFRKFRSTLHRRRRTIEAVELGYLVTGNAPEGAARPDATAAAAGPPRPFSESEAMPLDFSPSRKA